MADPLFRKNIPQDAKETRAWIDAMLDKLVKIGRGDDVWNDIAAFAESFEYQRGGLRLPGDAYEDKPGERYAITASSLKIERRNGRVLLQSAKGSVPVPEEIVAPVRWIVEKRDFTGDELARSFPDMPGEARNKLIQDLVGMRVLGSAQPDCQCSETGSAGVPVRRFREPAELLSAAKTSPGRHQ